MTVKIQARRDTAANWTSANPILSSGESGFEIDTNKLKIGDGSTAWNALAYFGAVAGLDTQIQFNTAGQFDASADFSYNPTTKQLSVANSVVVNAALGFVGNMLDLQANGLSRAKVSDVGTLTTVTDGLQVNENYVYYGSSTGTLTHRVYAARGTSDAPSVSLNGDRLIGYACFPRLSTGFATGPGCRMQFVYRGDASLNTRATDIEFETSIGVASLWPRLGIVNTGGIWLQEDGFVSGTVRRVFLHSDGANIFSQRDGANAQTFRLYNTYNNSTDYERLSVTWDANVCYAKPENSGTGSPRIFIPVTGATTVSALPAAATAGAGARAFVTDANSTTFLATAVGGGTNKVPVVSDGTNWLIG